MNIFRRSMSLLLVLVMCLSLFPTGTLALDLNGTAAVQAEAVEAAAETSTDVAVDDTNFPDSIFRSFVSENYDTDEDGCLSEDEIAAVTEMDCSGKDLSSLDGIEFFKNLETLWCYNNALFELDLTLNTALTELYCYNNGLTELDLRNNPLLFALKCFGNNLGELDLSMLPDLLYLDCSSNELSALDVSANTALTYLACYDNGLFELDLSMNTALKDLDCSGNFLAELDLSANTALENLDCSGQVKPVAVSSLQFDMSQLVDDISKVSIDSDSYDAETGIMDLAAKPASFAYSYATGRGGMDVTVSLQYPATAINETNFPDANFRSYVSEEFDTDSSGSLSDAEIAAVTEIWCSAMEITTLQGVEYFTALEELHCDYNSLTSLDVSANTALSVLWCCGNPLTELDVSKNTALTELYCGESSLTELDLSKNTALEYLSCSDSQVASLNVNGCSALESLVCGGCRLTQLDVSGCSALNYLICSNNRLTELDLSANTALENLTCGGQAAALTVDGSSCQAAMSKLAKDISKISIDSDNYDAEQGLLTLSDRPSAFVYNYATGFGSTAMDVTVSVSYEESSDGGDNEGDEVVTEIRINAGYFPDANFRSYVRNFDTDDDGCLSAEEIAAATEINCSGMSIADLSGIAYFTALTDLDCSYNELTELDLSANTALTYLHCYGNQLTALDVSTLTALQELNCGDNSLSELNVKNNVSLEALSCYKNALTELDVSANTALEYFYCYENSLTTLDLRKCTNLYEISCGDCAITQLDISSCESLRLLSCGNNQLTELDLSSNTELTQVNCSGNDIATLDLSSHSCLQELRCQNNQLTSLKVSSANLFWMECYNNSLTSLDLRSCEQMLYVVNNGNYYSEESGIVTYGNTVGDDTTYFEMIFRMDAETTLVTDDDTTGDDTAGSEGPAVDENGNILINATNFPDVSFLTYVVGNLDTDGDETLSAEEIASISTIRCGDLGIADLSGVEYFTALTHLYCYDNALTELDVSANTLLKWLSASDNQLTSLTLGTQESLETLMIGGNQLETLDVSGCSAVTWLDCDDNALTVLDVSSCTTLESLSCQNNDLTALTLGELESLDCLWAGGNQIAALDLSGCPALVNLSCQNNALTELDISENTAIEEFFCGGNQLTELDVSGCESLRLLSCGSNQLTELDLSANDALTALSCENNSLTALDLSDKPDLFLLNCSGNSITELDLSSHSCLQELRCQNNQLTSLRVSSADLFWMECYNNTLTSLDLRSCEQMLDVVSNSDYFGEEYGIATYGIGGYENDEGGTDYEITLRVDSEATLVTEDITPDADSILINETNFPDEYFRSYVSGYFDLNENGSLSADEIAEATEIYCSGCEIADLTGIEYFTSLQYLSCGENSLTELDLSANTALEYLDCSQNELTSLDISGCTSLMTLDCGINALTVLDVSSNIALTQLDCGENSLTGLDMSSCPALERLICDYNDLETLDLSGCTRLSYIFCPDNALTELDVSDCAALEILSCSYNDLTDLDLSSNTALENLTCSFTPLTALDLSTNTALTSLSCGNTDITALDLSKNTALNTLNCASGKLTALDLDANTALTWLNCAGNDIAALDLSSNTALTYVNCSNNCIPELDVSALESLGTLYCYSQNISYSFESNPESGSFSLAMSELVTDTGKVSMEADSYDAETAVLSLADKPESFTYTYDTGSTAMDVTVAVSYPPEELGLAIDAASFPDNNFRNFVSGNFDANGNGYLSASEIAAVTRIFCTNESISDLTGVEHFTALNSLICDDNGLTALNVSANTQLQTLSCRNNDLTSLTFGSGNTNLTYVDCGVNDLTQLDLSCLTGLQRLWCEENQLTTLDVSANPDLIVLDASLNRLTELDLSACAAFDSLSCAQAISYSFESVPESGSFSLAMSELVKDTSKVRMETENYDAETAVLSLADKPTFFTYEYNTGHGYMEVYVSVYYPLDIVSVDSFPIDVQFSAGGQEKYLSFVPETTGCYWFESKGDYDTYATLYDAGMNQITSDDDGGNTGTNFGFGASLTAGETYYLAVRFLDSEITGSFTVEATAGCHYENDVCVNCGSVDNSGIAIDETNFPDANFRSYVSSECDTSGNGLLSDAEIAGITAITCDKMDIADLTGIEYFTHLQYLSCNYNALTELDVSANTALTGLFCFGNDLTGLDVSANTNLTSLQCSDNQLESLILGSNDVLYYLDCNTNDLTELDVSGLSALESLHCLYNHLAELDLEGLEKLSILNIGSQSIGYTFTQIDETGAYCLDMSQLVSTPALVSTDVWPVYNAATGIMDLSDIPLNFCYWYDPGVTYESGEACTMDVTVELEYPESGLPAKVLTFVDITAGGQTKSVTFTPESTGCYRFESFGIHDSCADLYDSEWNFMAMDDDSGEGCNFRMDAHLQAGQTYTLYFSHTAYESTGRYTVTWEQVGSMCDWEEVRSPSYTEEGLEQRFCSYCGSDESNSIDKLILGVPSITGSSVASSGKPRLTWDAVDGATSYEVWRATSRAGTYYKMGSTTGTGYTNTGATAGTTYYYKVRAVAPDGSYSDYSNIVYRTCDYAQPVVSISCVAASGKIKLSWSAVDGATNYYVYRSTSTSGTYSYLGSTSGTSYVNTGAVAGTTYYYKVKAVGSVDAAASALSSYVYRTCDYAQPVVTASNVAASGKIRLSWSAVSGATKYYVYRATSSTGTYSYLGSTTGTTYVNTGAVAGTTYYYKVKALGSVDAATSALSSYVSLTCDYAQPVVSISCVAASGKPRLTWTAVDGATSYEVWRAYSADGTYYKMGTTTSTSYTNTGAEANTTYYYKVYAVGSSSYAKSSASAVKNMTCDCAQPVVSISCVAVSGKPRLSWSAVDGAVKYEVWRAYSKDGTYYKMGTTTGTNYTNTSAVAGTTYYYKVRAIGSSSYATSAYSTVVSKCCVYAQPDVSVTRRASDGKPVISWNAVSGAAKYIVYMSPDPDDYPWRRYTTTSNTSIVHTAAVAGNKYYYKVVAANQDLSILSSASFMASGFCTCAQPVITKITRSLLGKPKLTWNAVDGAVEYEVWRAYSANGTYYKMGSTTGTTYTNTSAKAGTTYYYRVKAIGTNSSFDSAFSSFVSVKAGN